MIIPEEITSPFGSLSRNYEEIGKIINPSKPDKDYVFFKYKNLLIIFTGGNWINKKTGEKKYLYYQACFPLDSLTWVVKMLEYFFTPPKDGGLPAGKISTTNIIAGEKLQFNRGMCVGGSDHGGYTLTNLTRIDYGEEESSKNFQEFDFPDPWLFNGGLMEFWKDLAKRYEREEFNQTPEE